MSSELAVQFDQVGKRFGVGAARYRSLRDDLAYAARAIRNLGRNLEPRNSFWALQDVSFDLRFGECLGILGANGAGKSTILKLVGRISAPTRGRIEIVGKVASLIEVGAGMHPELTGRENAFLYGAIMGMTQAEIRRRFDEIVAFAELEKFIDTPVKRYSSGMYMRLGFAVAVFSRPDVLLVDEVLAVGDIRFRLRCLQRIREMMAEGTAIVFVSHNLNIVLSMCRRGLVLDHGRAEYLGEIEPASAVYQNLMHRHSLEQATETEEVECPEDGRARLHDLRLVSPRATPVDTVPFGGDVTAEFGLQSELPGHDLVVFAALVRGDGVGCCSSNTEAEGVSLPECRRSRRLRVAFRDLSLLPGVYRLQVTAYDRSMTTLLASQMKTFQIDAAAGHRGQRDWMFVPRQEWRLLGERVSAEAGR